MLVLHEWPAPQIRAASPEVFPVCRREAGPDFKQKLSCTENAGEFPFLSL